MHFDFAAGGGLANAMVMSLNMAKAAVDGGFDRVLTALRIGKDIGNGECRHPGI